MLIFGYFEYTTVVKVSEKKTHFKIAALSLQGLCEMDPIIIFSEITVQEKYNAAGCFWESILEMH